MQPLVPIDGLQSGRAELRPWTSDDVSVRLEAGGDPDILRFTSVPERPSTGEACEWIRNSHSDFLDDRTASFVIVDRSTGSAAGSMALIRIDRANSRAEVGYWLLPRFRGKGLAGEALHLLTDWGLRRARLDRLELVTNLDNLASRRTAESAGYQFEGILRSYAIGRSGREDLRMYSRILSDLPR